MEPIRIARLVIRRFVAEDLAETHAYRSRLELAASSAGAGIAESLTRERIARFLESQKGAGGERRDRYNAFAIEHAVEGRVIGDVGMFLSPDPKSEGDLGYQLDPDMQGRGFATEAARALVDHGFRHWGLRRVTAACDAGNAPSYRLLERLGMRREGHLRQSRLVEGTPHDEFLYAVLRDE